MKTQIEFINILGKEFKILDHGFIRVIDFMGGDDAIVQSARVSYGAGTKAVSDDKALISYLVKHKHTSPLEMCEIKLHLKMPIFVARQWMRHRTASINEYSARYSEIKDEFYIPKPERLLKQSKGNKQCSGEELISEECQEAFLTHTKNMRDNAVLGYNTFNYMEDGDSLARELNRINITLNNYTEFYWKIDLHNFLHFVNLRDHPHAQYEIRVYAEKMLDIAKIWCPFAVEAFENYVMHAKTFSKSQLDALKKLLKREDLTQETSGLSKRDWNEIQELLK